ncbi:hypothetical protein GCM10023165_31660 [Variovorax defluvii]|uniref:Uncharacterized protein n=1 Tax=Variovorax defluvii TaxID=913761 RepID=A0ABP8HXG8_9BURK
MTSRLIKRYTRHSDKGFALLDDQWIDWVLQHQGEPGATNENGWGFGRVTHYSWYVGDERIEVSIDQWVHAHVLPDASGFIGFEKGWQPNNCVLLDVYGKERMRLTVPWQLTRPKNPESAKPPTSFTNVSDPYVNPENGKEGQFGVTAWVEYAGMYYFELDYRTGQFLWGREIRD